MAISKVEFEETKVGTQVAAVYGPSDFPTYDLCAETGIISDKVNGKWEMYFEIVMEDGRIEHMTSIASHNEIGFHILN